MAVGTPDLKWYPLAVNAPELTLLIWHNKITDEYPAGVLYTVDKLAVKLAVTVLKLLIAAPIFFPY
jgi:hypothetical protein